LETPENENLEIFHLYALIFFIFISHSFPYEFAGGHITGAVNIYTKDQLLKDILPSEPCPPIVHTWNDNGDFGSPERNVLIFHCEFSSERGPSL
jgi:hypothetical protein